jgi:hypothetical protein
VTTRSLNVALRLDYGDFTSGMGKAADSSRSFVSQEERLNAALAKSYERIDALKSKVIVAQSQNDYSGQKRAMEQFHAAQERSAKIAAQGDTLYAGRRQELAIQENALRTSLEERYFAATHTQLEVDLRQRASYYQQLRQMHAGNAQMLVQIDRTQAAETQAAMAQGGGGGGMLAMFGGKRLVKQELKYAAANVMGMHGGEAGMAISGGLMMPTVAGGLAVGGVAMLGMAYNAAHQQAKELEATQREHAKQVRESVTWMEKLVAAQSTASGRSYRGRADTLKERAEETEEKSRLRGSTLTLADTAGVGLDAIFHGGIENTAFGKRVLEEKKMADRDKAEAAKLLRWDRDEQKYEAFNRLEDMKSGVKSTGISGLADGPAKRRAALDQEQADARRHLDEEQFERVRNLSRYQGADKAQLEKENQQRELDENTQFDAKRLTQNANLVKQEARNERDARSEATQARIKADNFGFAREAKMLNERHKLEWTKAQENGENLSILRDKQQGENDELTAGRDKSMKDALEERVRATHVYNRELTQAQAEWQGIEKKMREAGATFHQILAAQRQFNEEARTRANKPLLDAIAKADIAIGLADLRHATAADRIAASRKQLDRDNPDASPIVRQRLAEQEEAQRRAEFARSQREIVKSPLEKFKEYREQIAEAVKHEEVSPTEQNKLLRLKWRELMGNPEVGKFETADQRWKSIQSGLIQDSNDPLRMSLKEQQEMNRTLQDLVRDGLPLRR